jgi:hypothetical protein
MNMEQLVEWELTGETETLAPVPHCLPPIPHDLNCDRTRVARCEAGD